MKKYILKYPVYNNIDFPIGTTVIITDDYWGKSSNDLNTGFTVVKGKLKGEKGCVVDGLKGYLLDDTIKNRNAVKHFISTKEKLKSSIRALDNTWKKAPTAKL